MSRHSNVEKCLCIVEKSWKPPDPLGINTQERQSENREEISRRELEAALEALKENEAAWRIRVLQRGVIADLGQQALSGAALQDLMIAATILATDTLETEFSEVLEIHPDGRDLFVLRAGSGFPQEAFKSKLLTASEATHGAYVVQRNEPLIIDNLRTESRFSSDYLKKQNIVSGICVVIAGLNKPFGVFGAYTSVERRFTLDEVNFLQTIANILGIASQRKQSDTVASRLALLVESSSDAIVYHDPDGMILNWNRAAERIFGYSKEEAVGRLMSFLIPPDKVQEFETILNQIRSGQSIEQFETVRLKKDGSRIDISMTLSPIHNEHGELIGLSLIARDITEQKKAAEKLRKSEMQLATAQRIGRMGSWEWELATGNLTWSDEEYRIHGLTPGEEMNLNKFIELVHPDDVEIVKEIATFPRPFALEHRIIRRDGQERSIFVRGDVDFDPEGKAIRIIGISQDVTEVKRAEEQLRRSREQLRALSGHLQFVREEERSKIAREVHDELGQVLTALKMDLSLLNQKLMESSMVIPRSQLFSEIKSMTKMVDSTIQSVRKIVTELRPEVLDHLGLKTAIEWQAQEFQSRTGIQCVLQAEFESFDVEDRDCATAIFRILQETLTNVAKHSGANEVDIRLRQQGNHLLLEVKDNGKGVSEDDLGKRESFGVLGMKERAVLMGGELQIEGTPGNGTLVTVKIPISSLSNLSDI